MRLLAPALAAIRSTRAPARPCAANSCLAASRMRIRMPSGSRCHFRVRFALAKTVTDDGASGVTRESGFEKKMEHCSCPSLEGPLGRVEHGSLPRRPLEQHRVDAAGAVAHAQHPGARFA